MTTLAQQVEGVRTVSGSSERDAIFPSPATGQKVYNQTTGNIEEWNGAAWETALLGAAELPADGRTVVSLETYLSNNAITNVKDYGATGDGVTNDTAAVQLAINSRAGGTVYFPPGRYMVNALTIGDNIVLRGEGGSGAVGSILVARTVNGSIFTGASFSFVKCVDLGFDSEAAGTYAWKQTDLTVYSQSCSFENCHFYRGLSECLYGNFIFLEVDADCSFGYFGNLLVGQTQHRHVYSKGVFNGNTTNRNRLNGRYYRAYVTESVRFEAGYQLDLSGNWETNECTTQTLYIKGCYLINLDKVWAENNTGTSFAAFADDTSGTIGNYVINVQGCMFFAIPANTRLLDISGAAFVKRFVGNGGNGWAGKDLAQSISAFEEYHGNRFNGAFAAEPQDPWAAWTAWGLVLADVTAGGAMTISALTVSCARYKRIGTTIHVVLDITVTTAGVANDKINIKLPANIRTPATNIQYAVGYVIDGGAPVLGRVHSVDANPTASIQAQKADGANFGIGAGRQVVVNFCFETA